MCFRFLQVMTAFIKTGELPHHDHGHVDGLDAEEPLPVDANPYGMGDNLHPRDLHHSLNGESRKDDTSKGGRDQ